MSLHLGSAPGLTKDLYLRIQQPLQTRKERNHLRFHVYGKFINFAFPFRGQNSTDMINFTDWTAKSIEILEGLAGRLPILKR